MHADGRTPDDILRVAIAAVRGGGRSLARVLDGLPAAVHVTDAQGVVTHYSRSRIAVAGRTPRVGKDRWCVTWRL